MPARARSIAILTLLLGVGLTSWTLQSLDEEAVGRQPKESPDPDSYIEHFVRTAMDEEGNIATQLRAPYMAHFPVDGRNELTKPTLDVYNARGKPWHASADRAWVSGAEDVILLFGKVHLWREDSSGNREWDLYSAKMRVLPKQEYAETKDPVTIVGKNTVTRSVGLKADLIRDRLELSSRVRSRHEVRSDR
ncbi:MAG: LPS export ABC transporter periplasmic protein LptC [Gammaproteobacteria bacterium]